MSDVKNIEMGEDAVTNPSTDSEALEVKEPETGLIRVVCSHLSTTITPNSFLTRN